MHADVPSRLQPAHLGDVLEWPVIFRPERKFQVGASRGNTQEFDQAQQAIDLEAVIGVEQETLRIGAVPTGLQKTGGDPRPSRAASGLAILPYVWGGRDLRAVAPRSDSANFPGFFSILCSVFRDSVVTIFRVISWNSPDF